MNNSYTSILHCTIQECFKKRPRKIACLQNGVLYVNGTSLGELTEDQIKELEDYLERVKQWNDDLNWSITQVDFIIAP